MGETEQAWLEAQRMIAAGQINGAAELFIGHEDLFRGLLEETCGKGNVFDTSELTANFSVAGFMAPFVIVKRKSDGVEGSLTFTHRPRFYFDFKELTD